jgi:hypothetical protein
VVYTYFPNVLFMILQISLVCMFGYSMLQS